MTSEDEVLAFVLENFDEILVSNPFGRHAVLANSMVQDKNVSPYNLFIEWTDVILSRRRFDDEQVN